MAKRKTEFELKCNHPYITSGGKAFIGKDVKGRIVVTIGHYAPRAPNLSLSGKSLETFAVNILKALKSKHLKP